VNPVTAPVLARLERLHESIVRVIRGKAEIVDALVAALIARGHVLVEDVPGWGRRPSPGAGALARPRVPPHPVHVGHAAVGHHRHLRLPASERRLPVMAGPLFANVVLADEINRAARGRSRPCSRR